MSENDLRSTGAGTKIVKALGADSYGSLQGDARELLSKNVVNGSYTLREVLKGWDQAEAVKHVTSCCDVVNTAMMFVIINNGKRE